MEDLSDERDGSTQQTRNEALKERTGKRNAEAALKAWAVSASPPSRAIAELRAALRESLKEEAAGKGKRESGVAMIDLPTEELEDDVRNAAGEGSPI